MTIDVARTSRGAAAGAVAAGVWALAQPLDKLLLRCDYDDVELLGRAVTRGEEWYPVGLAMHLTGGAVFGALYALVAPAVPLPPRLRGPVLALAEHVAGWPLVALTDRLHPARARLPKLSGNRRAYAQATWRHLLFGVVLGELERRLNERGGGASEPDAVEYSGNGHGRLDRAMSVLVEPGK
jgi:hypothetical protein